MPNAVKVELSELKEIFLNHQDKYPIMGNYAFMIDDKKSVVGHTNYTRMEIAITKDHLNYSDRLEVIDTLLHEIAHVLSFLIDGYNGHGFQWKKWCVELGATPSSRCYDPFSLGTPISKYSLTCPSCGKVHRMHRNTKSYYFCAICHKNGIKKCKLKKKQNY